MTPDPPPVVGARDEYSRCAELWEIAVGVVTLPWRIVGAVVELLALCVVALVAPRR